MLSKLPGFEYMVVRDTIEARAEMFADLRGPRVSAPQRRADALVPIAQDSREPGDPDVEPLQRSEPPVTVFVDAEAADKSRGEGRRGDRIWARLGPMVLDRILCEGRIQLIGLRNGKPVVTSDAVRAMPAIRRFVKWRDGACAVAGCQSRYRLQVHHIRPRADSGSHDPDNLTTLCWLHHHVVIHGLGFRIDPAASPQGRRFLRNCTSGADPPG